MRSTEVREHGSRDALGSPHGLRADDRAPIALVHGTQQARTVGCQGLRRKAARCHDRREIIRAERIDCGSRDLLRGRYRLSSRDGPVHQDENEASVLIADLIRRYTVVVVDDRLALELYLN
jgi:hypothetical protein